MVDWWHLVSGSLEACPPSSECIFSAGASGGSAVQPVTMGVRALSLFLIVFLNWVPVCIHCSPACLRCYCLASLLVIIVFLYGGVCVPQALR